MDNPELKTNLQERFFGENEGQMKDLVDRLNEIPRAYFDFVVAIAAYARKKPERLEKVMEYLDSTPDLTTSDMIRFVSIQPDFREDSICDW